MTVTYDVRTSRYASDGYNFCRGCGGQEPIEVLRQMGGYCTSQCEDENGQKFDWRTGLLLAKKPRVDVLDLE